MKYKLIWIVFSLLCWVGCYEEDALTPTVGGEFKYTVPQGNHEYDNRIVEWNKKGDFYILYKFDPEDIYFNLSQWEGSVYDTAKHKPGDGLISLIAQEEYAGKQLDLIEETFLNFYSDTALLRWMPAKLLLCSELKKIAWGSEEDLDMNDGFDNIAFNWGNEQIGTLLADRKRKVKFKTDVNKLLFKRILGREILEVPADFAGVSEYAEGEVERDEMYSLGFVRTSWIGLTSQEDMLSYVEAIISYSYAELTADPEEDNYDPVGMLNPEKDVNGLIRKKYDYLISYFKNIWHMDLQAIGNYQKQ